MRPLFAGTLSAALMIIAVLSCIRPDSKPAAHIEQNPPVNSADDPALGIVPVKVLDEKNGAPIVGAKITPICMGLTPYGTNFYLTDTNGSARVITYVSTIALNVTDSLYKQKIFFTTYSNEVLVTMKKL